MNKTEQGVKEVIDIFVSYYNFFACLGVTYRQTVQLLKFCPTNLAL